MVTKVVFLAVITAASLQAQTFTLDGFETGGFEAMYNADFTQDLSEPDVLGGKRTIRLVNGSGTSFIEMSPNFYFNKTDNSSIVTLRYGDYVGDVAAEDLHWNLGLGYFDVEFGSLSAPITMSLSLRGNDGFMGQEKVITSTGVTTFSVADFTGDIDLSDVSGVELGFYGPTPSVFTIASVTGEVSPVPEPSTYAMAFGVLLVGFAATRRHLVNRTK